MKINFEQTTIATNFSKAFLDEGLNYPENGVPATYAGIFTAVAVFLSSIKDKEKTMALVIDNVKGDIEFGAYVKWIGGETDEDGGNWNLVASFDPADFVESDDMKVIKFSSGAADNTIRYCSMRQKPYAIGYNSDIILKRAVCLSVAGIKEWLSDNAKEGEDVYLNLPGIFEAKVRIEEDGTKSMSLEFSEEVTQNIKKDEDDQK